MPSPANNTMQDATRSSTKVPHEKSAPTPPTSEDWNKNDGSDLSDLELGNDEEEVEPDHYWGDGEIPVFKPTMAQFRSFKDYVAKIDKYGMKSGIVKVIPPKEWKDSLRELDEAVKGIKVKNPITQEFAGTHGTYTQANIEKQRSYNLPQWKSLTEESQHQPPARRGESRKNTAKAARAPPKAKVLPSTPTAPADTATSPENKKKPGRPRRTPLPHVNTSSEEGGISAEVPVQGPPTPTSPEAMSRMFEPDTKPGRVARKTAETVGKPKASQSRSKGSQPKSVSERRKYNRREVADQIDEAAFVDFDYRMANKDEFTPERCAELETSYWKTITFAPPLYGADMPGSLFDETTTSWNVAKLENILDILGQNVPGVNTAYLYLGMWKATYAWHLEDVDLYSINYIHFGAPKQWYSISQEDARRFENAMKSIWPQDAKNCSQFLRHKTYLISPAVLQSQFNIRVNKLVHYEGEFVITFPYGYHSGYNLGYNCAESVNFATESWLDYGKIAKKCDCEADSVWIDVEDIERKLRGEPTPEYYEETDFENDVDDDGSRIGNLPSPPATVVGKSKSQSRKRKREQTAPKVVKKIKIRLKPSYAEPCVLCPNDMPFEPLLQTDTGRYAHRVCALYTPETYMEEEDGIETICGVANIDKARLDLKCSFCRGKKGACFQCSSKKCTRAFHATCAAAAGVQVDLGPVPVYGEDGTEYASEAYDFRCRFHRAKRSKNVTGDSLENNQLIQTFAQSLEPNHVIQMQLPQGEVFAGVVIENRPSERTVFVTVLPEGDRVEVEWKYVLALDPADSQLPKVSAGAKPMPSHMDRNTFQTRNLEFGPPQADDMFGDARYPYKWAEFRTGWEPRNPSQVAVNLSKVNQMWYYLGETSTEAKAQFTEDPALPRHNIAGNFLETVKPVIAVVKRELLGSGVPPGMTYHPLSGGTTAVRSQSQTIAQQPYRSYPSQLGFKQPAANATNGLLHDPRRLQPGQGGGISAAQPSAVGQAPMYIRKPRAPVAWSSTHNAGGDAASVSAATARNLSLADPVRPPIQTKREEDQHKHEQQPPQSRPTGMLPLADLLGTPDLSGAGKPALLESTTEREYLTHLAQYPYLKNSYLRRLKIYQSPYKSGGGYSSLYAVAQPSYISGEKDESSTLGTTSEQATSMPTQDSVGVGPFRASYGSTPHPPPPERSYTQGQYQSPQAFQQEFDGEATHRGENKDVYNRTINQIRYAAESQSSAPHHIDNTAAAPKMQGHLHQQAPAPLPPGM